MKYNATTSTAATTAAAPASHSISQAIAGNSTSANSSTALFSDQVNTVTNLFENWNDCERTIVIYALLKRLRYPSLKFLQYSIDNNLTQSLSSASQSNLNAIVVDISANNPAYLLNIINAYQTLRKSCVGGLGNENDVVSSSSSDKESMPCFGSDFQITQCDERRPSLPVYHTKEEILHEVLNMLPMLKPGNEEAKMIYLSLVPLAVKDTITQGVPIELVQQIFSYLLIHPAISNDDKKALNVWLRHLEQHIQTPLSAAIGRQQQADNSISFNTTNHIDNTLILSSASSTTSSASSGVVAAPTSSVSSSLGGSVVRNHDWQTIAPPTKVQKDQQPQSKATPLHNWSSVVAGPSIGVVPASINIADKLCDNLNGITLNELASSQNSLGLTIGGASAHDGTSLFGPSLVNGVAAAAGISATSPLIFGNPTNNPIIHIISNNGSNCINNLNVDDHDTSFSKNGTEILDFEPCTNNLNDNSCTANNVVHQQQQQQQNNQPDEQPHELGYASVLLMNNFDQTDCARWSLDGKLTSLKTRRSNSLTTQAISSSASSSSNSSVNTVNENCSNSNENLSQFANKPRSYSLSIENSRGALTNSGSDTRLDDFKPNYIKFQSRNLGMSTIGLWLKSLRLHKYIELFKNMTYEEMLQISEEYLQSLGVTKGASHKLALCIEKLKDRHNHLTKMEQDLLTGQLKVQDAVEDLANIVLTPMKPIESAMEEENVALKFLKVIDLVCSLFQKDSNAFQDEESCGVLLWILERGTHNEAFANQASHFKDLKFKLSKLKISITPKILHSKNLGSNGNLNKPRWNGKPRKSDTKNGSTDRINHRKNSNDLLNFSLSNMQQQQQQQQQQQHSNSQQQHQSNDYDKFSHNNPQFKSSSYTNFVSTQQPHQQMTQQQLQQQQQQHHHQQQQQKQAQMPKQILVQLGLSQQFPALPQHAQQPQVSQQHHQQHRRSLNNIVVVNNGPQQPQKIIFKPGQAVLSSTGTTTTTGTPTATPFAIENAAMKNQQRRASFTGGVSNNVAASYQSKQPMTGKTTNPERTTQQQQQQQQKKTMAAVVMENLPKFEQHFSLF